MGLYYKFKHGTYWRAETHIIFNLDGSFQKIQDAAIYHPSVYHANGCLNKSLARLKSEGRTYHLKPSKDEVEAENQKKEELFENLTNLQKELNAKETDLKNREND